MGFFLSDGQSVIVNLGRQLDRIAGCLERWRYTSGHICKGVSEEEWYVGQPTLGARPALCVGGTVPWAGKKGRRENGTVLVSS